MTEIKEELTLLEAERITSMWSKLLGVEQMPDYYVHVLLYQ